MDDIFQNEEIYNDESEENISVISKLDTVNID